MTIPGNNIVRIIRKSTDRKEKVSCEFENVDNNKLNHDMIKMEESIFMSKIQREDALFIYSSFRMKDLFGKHWSKYEKYVFLRTIFTSYHSKDWNRRCQTLRYIQDLMECLAKDNPHLISNSRIEELLKILQKYIRHRVDIYLANMDKKLRGDLDMKPTHLEMWLAFHLGCVRKDKLNTKQGQWLAQMYRECGLIQNRPRNRPDFRNLAWTIAWERKQLLESPPRSMQPDSRQESSGKRPNPYDIEDMDPRFPYYREMPQQNGKKLIYIDIEKYKDLNLSDPDDRDYITVYHKICDTLTRGLSTGGQGRTVVPEESMRDPDSPMRSSGMDGKG